MSELLTIRDFVIFMGMRLVMIFGSTILSVAVGWHIYKITENPLALGLIGLVQFLPFIASFLVAGWVADQVDRRFILLISNSVDAVAVIAVALFFLNPPEQFWLIYLLLVFHGTARSFTHPAQQALLTNLVPEDLFPRAVAMSSSVLKLGQLGGPALGGILIATVNYGSYFVSAVCFGLAAVLSLLYRANLRISEGAALNWESITGGFQHMGREPLVLAAVLIDLIIVLFGSVMGLLPIYVQDILGAGPETLGVLRAAPGLGALVVALILARTTPTFHMGRMFLAALMAFGCSILVFGLSTTVWISLIALLLYGATDMLSVYVRMTLVQLRTPDALRGRVSAINSVAINASNELGDFRAGTMAAAFGPVPSVVIGGAMCLATALISWRAFPQLRALKVLS
ncbi:MAG: MFS transporter [Pseudomonadota bacterium]